MKILNVNQLSQVHSLDSLVRERMVEKIEILNENYGENRMIGDLGGFVMYHLCESQGTVRRVIGTVPCNRSRIC